MLLKEVNKFMKKSFTEVTTQIINNINVRNKQNNLDVLHYNDMLHSN